MVGISLSWPWKHFTVYIRFWICTKQPESNLTGQPKSCQFVSFDFTTVFESLSLCKQLSVCPLSLSLLAKCPIHFSQLLKICDCIHVDWSLNSLRLRVLTSEKLKKRIQNVTVSLIEVLSMYCILLCILIKISFIGKRASAKSSTNSMHICTYV